MRKVLKRPQREAVLKKTNGRCAYCGCELEYKQMQIDHISPISVGGDNSFENLFASCQPCNHRKGTFSLEGFRKELEKQLKILRRDSATYRNAVRFGLVIENSHRVEFYFEKMEEDNG